ncbi:MAG: DUF4331 family protein [Planctomycetaceae bacterium]
MPRHRHLIRLFVAVLLLPGMIAVASDHLDSPSVMEDGRLDVNDLYVFQSPENPDNTVMIMTVNPGAGVLSPMNFRARARYEFLVDQDGDAKPDVRFRVQFSSARRNGIQVASLFRDNKLIARGRTERTVNVKSRFGGGLMRAGLFEDPFFFDLNGFNDGFNFTGDDFFAGLNVSAICIEVPSSTLGGPNVGVWARTVFKDKQFDRAGRPAIATVLVKSGRKDEFNVTAPRADRRKFRSDMNEIITSLNGGDVDTAKAISLILLPDILTVNTSDSSGFLNGRRLEDDVIDAELNLLTKGAVTGDGVDGNDVDFLDVFPYLGPPN